MGCLIVTSIAVELISRVDVKLQTTELHNVSFYYICPLLRRQKFQDPISKRAIVAHNSDICMIDIMI